MVEGLERGLQPIFMRHVVALSLLDAEREFEEDSLPLDYQPGHILFSAFVISVQNIWFLITAGHILRDIETRIKSGRRIVKARLIDSLQDNQNKMSIPFDFHDAPKAPIYREEEGIDYGVILLRACYVRLLVAGGTRAFNENEYKDLPGKAEKYFLLGFPSQARKINHTRRELGGNITIDIGCPLLPIQPVDDPPAELRLTEKRFYVKVPIIPGNRYAEDGIMTDIDGMSGGPIIAVKKINSGEIRYWIIGVQSGWLKSKRILAACYMEPLINALQGCIKRLKGEKSI